MATASSSPLWNDGRVPLCPVCFNAPDYCECETRYEPSADELRRLENRPRLTAERETEERLLREVDAERRDDLREIVAGLVDIGAWLETPPAVVPDYVNVRVPSRFGPARLCSINRSTGRIEFHDESYPVAEQLRLGHHFTRLPAGDKAAITVKTAEEVQAVLTLARAVLASRRASG